MSEAELSKQEWVFDGTRFDFWVFVSLTCWALFCVIIDLRNLFWAYHRPLVKTSWIDWLAAGVLLLVALEFYQIEKLLGIATGLSSAGIALKLAISHQVPGSDRLILIRNVIDLLTSGLLLLGCAMYLKHRLRREPASTAGA